LPGQFRDRQDQGSLWRRHEAPRARTPEHQRLSQSGYSIGDVDHTSADNGLAPQPRAICYSCFRPPALCFCRYLAPVENRTQLLIIQHPHERFHPLNSARILERCLRRVRIAVDYDRVLRDGTRSLELPAGAALLFPGPEAKNLATLPRSLLPSALVVLDGTWHHARSLYRELPALHSLPKVSFEPAQPSRYRIRKEPSAECVSTVEAVVAALEFIEPETPGLGSLLRAFSGMIDLQIAAAAAHPRLPRFARKDRQRSHGLPPLLAENFEQVVVVYAEATFVGARTVGLPRAALRREPRRLIHWVARRLRTGERFSAVIHPGELPSENRLCPTGLTADDLLGGVNLARARRDWRAFSLPKDVLLSWNKSTLDVMRPLEHEGPVAFLKGTYKNLAHRRNPTRKLRGSIDAVIDREGLQTADTPLRGRAGLRLSQLEAVTRFVHECAMAASP
jgi:DTW domain-containing protein YfiP